MAEPAYKPETDRRQSPRYVGLRKQIMLESAVFYDQAMLIDIGKRGFSAQTIINYQPGTRILLHLPGHEPVESYAVWHAKQRLGARFTEPLDDAILLSLNEAK